MKRIDEIKNTVDWYNEQGDEYKGSIEKHAFESIAYLLKRIEKLEKSVNKFIKCVAGTMLSEHPFFQQDIEELKQSLAEGNKL